MCYDIKTSLEAQLKRAKRRNDLKAIEEIIEKLAPLTDLPIYHSSGFNHPEVLIYTDRSPDFPEVATWGLVPYWVRDNEQRKELWNNTLNARGETIFEKPSFRTAARNNRCVIYVDGFYEHYYKEGKTFPFFIYHKNKEPLALAGLWSEWHDPESRGLINTFTIVTTKANKLMERIHNNPKIKESRMPLILPTELEEKWLNPIMDDLDIAAVQELIQKYPEGELIAHPVAGLRGKTYQGNVEGISKMVNYHELTELP
ncbi:SOS response-associated peptidase [Maribacter sp. CXY002]|uniref:SOS response-associated peptidase n=1 Tax=Maribacter luteocoastalis TaxID=3407671 RepID=UPI003B675F0F